MDINSNLLYLQVKEALLEKMKSMKPNDRIPSRNELIKEYNVTRTTVDRAISELIGEGYIYSRDGSGTYISESSGQEKNHKGSGVISWGIILPNIMHDTYPGILRGVEDIANENGINAVICNTDNNTEKQANYIYKLIDSGIRGIVIVPAISDNYDLAPFKVLQQSNIPFVFCNRGIPGVQAPKVISNNFFGSYITTKHLIEQGYRKIAFVSRPMYSSSSERYQGYTSALAEAGIDINEEYVVFEDSFDLDRPGYDSTMMILGKNTLPDAVFCFNDVIAKGAYDAITDCGLKVGQEIGLVGYDNTSICESMPVKLTSVKFKTYETGAKAADLLLTIMRGESVQKNKTIILQPELVARESSCTFKHQNE